MKVGSNGVSTRLTPVTQSADGAGKYEVSLSTRGPWAELSLNNPVNGSTVRIPFPVRLLEDLTACETENFKISPAPPVAGKEMVRLSFSSVTPPVEVDVVKQELITFRQAASQFVPPPDPRENQLLGSDKRFPTLPPSFQEEASIVDWSGVAAPSGSAAAQAHRVDLGMQVELEARVHPRDEENRHLELGAMLHSLDGVHATFAMTGGGRTMVFPFELSSILENVLALDSPALKFLPGVERNGERSVRVLFDTRQPPAMTDGVPSSIFPVGEAELPLQTLLEFRDAALAHAGSRLLEGLTGEGTLAPASERFMLEGVGSGRVRPEDYGVRLEVHRRLSNVGGTPLGARQIQFSLENHLGWVTVTLSGLDSRPVRLHLQARDFQDLDSLAKHGLSVSEQPVGDGSSVYRLRFDGQGGRELYLAKAELDAFREQVLQFVPPEDPREAALLRGGFRAKGGPSGTPETPERTEEETFVLEMRDWLSGDYLASSIPPPVDLDAELKALLDRTAEPSTSSTPTGVKSASATMQLSATYFPRYAEFDPRLVLVTLQRDEAGRDVTLRMKLDEHESYQLTFPFAALDKPLTLDLPDLKFLPGLERNGRAMVRVIIDMENRGPGVPRTRGELLLPQEVLTRFRERALDE